MRFDKSFLILALGLLVSCEKVSPIGIFAGGTAVEDRVKMSNLYYEKYLDDYVVLLADKEYSFLVGADSHVTRDPGRMDEMLAIGLEHDDLFYAHLGDIADTKAEYYIVLDSLLQEGKKRYVEAKYEAINDYEYIPKGADPIPALILDYDEIRYPFFPVVGNHDITRNGWALWSNIFHSSFYEITVIVDMGDDLAFDHLIFLDSASGTLGRTQIDLIQDGILDGDQSFYRNTFVFTHTNIFRPQFFEFASTFTREETFFLLDQFEKWNVTCVFCGHVHMWDERDYNNVHYVTLKSMCERENRGPGDYLVRINVKENGDISMDQVHMEYSIE